MPTAVHNKRIRNAQKSAKKKGYQVSKAFKIRAALGLFISSAPVKLLTIDMAYKIYSLRWQIELTFKIWKSICKIDKVKKVKKERLECYILAKLLIIVLCWRIAWFTSRLLKQHCGKDLSYYKSFKTLMRDMHRLEQLFVAELIPAVDYLIEFLKLSSRKHLLEKKKGQSYSPEVMVMAENDSLPSQDQVELFLSEVEDALQGFSDIERIQEVSQESEGWLVGDPVKHLNPAGHRADLMVMVPEAIRAKPLFVDKRMAGTDMFDLGNPGVGAEQRNGDPVDNDQPIVHHGRDLGDDGKTQVGRGDSIEVGRILEKIPGCLDGCRQPLSAFQDVHPFAP
jgi:hypothetical protein